LITFEAALQHVFAFVLNKHGRQKTLKKAPEQKAASKALPSETQQEPSTKRREPYLPS
jgi:hypothetical protein